MLHPPLDNLLNRGDSKYTLVVAAARRARQLLEDSPPLVDSKSKKSVTVALEEISEGMITAERTRSGVK